MYKKGCDFVDSSKSKESSISFCFASMESNQKTDLLEH